MTAPRHWPSCAPHHDPVGAASAAIGRSHGSALRRWRSISTSTSPTARRSPPPQIADHAALSTQLRDFYQERSHQQAGDPARLAQVLLQLAASANPPRRFSAGSDALAIVDARRARLRDEAQAWCALSASVDGQWT